MIEDLLREAASLQDEQEKARIVHAFASRPDETLDTLIDVLQHPDSPLTVVACQVIREIGYPRNVSAIPILLTHAGDDNSPLQFEAMQTLIAMGPSILQYIIRIAKEDDVMGVLVDKAFSSAGDYVSDNQIRDRLIQELANHPDESLDAALYILQNPLKEWWEVALQVIHAIGYPNNAPAIPLLIAHASMGNDPAESDAIQALLALGPDIVIPYLIDALYNGGHTNTYLWVSASDICGLLRSHQLGQEHVDPCGPMIAYLLSQTPKEQKHIARRLLQVLEKIGPKCAAYALPALIHVVLKGANDEVGIQAQRFIEFFDKKVMEPYVFLLSGMPVAKV